MVKPIVINIHSTVDLITNSSTSIFTSARADAPETIREIIQSILDVAGSDKKVDDLFDIKLIADGELYCNCEEVDDNGNPITPCPICNGEGSYVPSVEQLTKAREDSWYENPAFSDCQFILSVYPKGITDDKKELVNKIRDLFEIAVSGMGGEIEAVESL